MATIAEAPQREVRIGEVGRLDSPGQELGYLGRHVQCIEGGFEIESN